MGYKWIFKKKMEADESIDKYKARLLVKRYKQKRVLITLTHLLVIRITSIITLIAIIVINNIEIHPIDVKIAFLNGDLKDKIYTEQPEGFVTPEKKVCKLIKSLYELK